jgi:O-succinylbenzoic acid--CoA ligase
VGERAVPAYPEPVTPRRLEPIAVPTGPAVLDLLPALRAALSGHGPALLPHPAGTAPSPFLAPGRPLAAGEDDPADPTVAVLATSGSTGRPKGALLPASALLASVSATHDRLGGPGRWLLALPAEHVAGLQVLLRSLVAGTEPVVLELTGGFDPEAFARAAQLTTGHRRYTALVPTQLRRLLTAGDAARAALVGFDAVLVGGASADQGLLEQAADAGVRVVTTYGMSETCGGCVYDGRPLDGVRVELDDDGRIRLGGPVVARGYRGAEPTDAFSTGAFSAGAFATGPDGVRWFRTDDTGRLLPGGLLGVTGRVDDLIVTGGVKVAPALVEAALLELPGIAEAVVVGIPDPDWGQRVAAAVVLVPGRPAPDLGTVRDAVGRRLGRAAAPAQLVVLEHLPLRGPGKPDREALRRLAASAHGEGGDGPGLVHGRHVARIGAEQDAAR